MVASVGACLLDLLFCIGAICLISAFSRPDKRNRPNFLVYIMGMHVPLIALCSPLNNLPLFCAVVSLAAVVAYAVYAFAMTKRHLSNIGRIDND
jgi:Ca2+/Na+ antiporter